MLSILGEFALNTYGATAIVSGVIASLVSLASATALASQSLEDGSVLSIPRDKRGATGAGARGKAGANCRM